MNALKKLIADFIHDDVAVKHTIALGIFAVFATSYIKVCWVTRDFADLDWGWAVVLLGLAGIQAAPEIVSRFKESKGQ